MSTSVAGKWESLFGISFRWIVAFICSVIVLIATVYGTETDIQAGLLTANQAVWCYGLMISFIVCLGLVIAAIIRPRVINRSAKGLIAFLIMTASLAAFGILNIEESVRLNDWIPLGAIRAHYFRDYYIVLWLFITSPACGLALALAIYLSSRPLQAK
jgi:hypothetical protein